MSERNGRITFLIGGARSGKSSFALARASEHAGKKAFIATAQAFDAEMEERIAIHKAERTRDWDTVEEPFGIAEAIKKISDKYEVIVIDCLTLWLSNLLLAEKDMEKEIDAFVISIMTHKASQVYIVSNEVGMGIVPENNLARRFRDLAGHLNQKLAHIADEVYLVTAGIPLRIKP